MRPEKVPARPECPEPARWWAPDSDATEIDVTHLIAAFVTALKPDLIIETGSYHGDTTEAIGEALQALRHGWLISVECDPQCADVTRQRVLGLPVAVVEGAASEFIPKQPIDLLFIDCETKGRLKQLQHFKSYASPRCVILMHDSALPYEAPGVPELYDVMTTSVVEGLVYPWTLLPTPRGLAITRYC
jgi:predicted O-methyltransferase YrrM